MKINIPKLRREMRLQSLRPVDLANRMRRKDQWVSAILAGRAGKTFRAVEDLGKALKVNPKDLLE